ncbi:SMI1/KNR4 family protein [Actinoplanes sichuanensis]|uniref:SMI1/KNR4 family protein n=1 Tax=Actinoplanes sichuanensis TaxID=512349 RepID=A0ABW4ALE2_9ACTN|nr:SMI1/KNR4 family protein [Actinoplanes sichuanensis]
MKRLRSVGASWAMILAWFTQHAPNELTGFRSPSAQQDLRAVEETMGMPLPADQVEWWQLTDGTDEARFVRLIPLAYRPLSARDAVLFHRSMVSFAPEEPESSLHAAAPAGSPSEGVWLPQWLPIARDIGGGFLFLDLRRGPLFGCVGRHRKDEWRYEEPVWSSVAEMLADVADALTENTEIDWWHAGVDDDRLVWLMD